MAQITRSRTIWLPTGNPDTTNITSADFNALGGQPGSLGLRFDTAGGSYQRVQLDSGATASTSVGVVAANQLAYWKSKANYIVTNDVAQALGGAGASNSAFRNFVAGIFRMAVTAGNYCDVLQKGQSIAVKSDANGAVGDYAVSDTSTSTARVTAVTAGTAPTCRTVGVIRAAASGGNINVDVDIPEV